MTDCEKMEMFINDNYPMQYVLWEQQFYVDENNINLEDDDITFMS